MLLSPSALKFINSWKKYFQEYNIIEWNEDNFDVNMIPYTREAYKDKNTLSSVILPDFGSYINMVILTLTQMLYKAGMIPSHELQLINVFWIYPEDVFCPLDLTTRVLTITDNTVSIHHYTCSWQNSKLAKIRHQIRLQLVRLCAFKIATAIVNSITF